MLSLPAHLGHQVVLEERDGETAAAELALERVDEDPDPRLAAGEHDVAVAAAAVEGRSGSVRHRIEGTADVERGVHAARRRRAYADDSDDRVAAAIVVGDLRRDLTGEAQVHDPCVAHEQPEQRPAEPVEHGAAGAVCQQHAPLEDSAPAVLLRAGQLGDAHPVVHQFVDELGHGARSKGSTEVAGVLVEQAVRDEHHAAAAIVAEPVGHASGAGVGARKEVDASSWRLIGLG